MKTRFKIVSMATAFAMSMSLMLPTVFAADVADNPEGTTIAEIVTYDEMQINNGTITTNNGVIYTNNGTVTNNAATVYENYGTIVTNNQMNSQNFGTVTTNNGEIGRNFGTVTNNTGTVHNNYGGTVNGGTVINEYPHMIEFILPGEKNGFNISAVSLMDSDFYDGLTNPIFAKDGVSLVIMPKSGYRFVGEASIKNGSLSDNEDGSYTLENISDSDTITLNIMKESDMVSKVEIAYKQLQDALKGSDLDALKSAVTDFNDVLDIYNTLSDTQRDELGAAFGKTGQEMFSEVLGTWLETNIFFELYNKALDYVEEPNTETAKVFDEYFKQLLADENYSGSVAMARKFYPQIDEAHQQARATLGEFMGDNTDQNGNNATGESGESQSTSSQKDTTKSPTTMDMGAVEVLKAVAENL